LFIVWYFFFQIACIFLLYSTEKCFTPKHNYFRTREHFFELWTIILNCPNTAWIVIFSNSVDIFPLFEFFFDLGTMFVNRMQFVWTDKDFLNCANIFLHARTFVRTCGQLFWIARTFFELVIFLELCEHFSSSIKNLFCTREQYLWIVWTLLRPTNFF
jgi:hypothetical protein